MEGKQGVTVEHTGACVSHDVPYFPPHIRFIAMHSAISTGCFSFLKRAHVETLTGIIQEVAAIITQGGSGFMPVAAIDTYHRFNSFSLSQHSGVFCRHS